MKIRKLTRHPVINRMKLAGTCSLLKECHEKKKIKKNGTPILGSGTPTFWLGLLLFIKRESRTPTFKILVRTLNEVPLSWILPQAGFHPGAWSKIFNNCKTNTPLKPDTTMLKMLFCLDNWSTRTLVNSYLFLVNSYPFSGQLIPPKSTRT